MTNFANGWIATLSAGIDDSDTTVAVSSTDGMPVRPFQVLIEAEGSNADEIITVTDLTSSTITLTRASEPISDGSQVASAHANGATISHVLTAGSLTALVSGGATLNFVIDGGGSAITTGIKGDLRVSFACTVDSWTLLADQSGSIVIDIWKDTLANFPPTDGDSMCSGKEPTLVTDTDATDTTLTDWTTDDIAAGDVLRFNVDSATSVTRVTLALAVTRV